MMTTITPMIQKILFILHPSLTLSPRDTPSVSNESSTRKVPARLPAANHAGRIHAGSNNEGRTDAARAYLARLRDLGGRRWFERRANSPAPPRDYARRVPPSIGLCSDRATLRALALAYRRERLRGASDAAARAAATAEFVGRHPTAPETTAAEAVALMLAMASAPDPNRATLRAVALAYREARHSGAPAATAYEAAVDAYLERHPDTPPLDAYGAVAGMIAVAVERSPQWFWRGTSAPRGNDL